MAMQHVCGQCGKTFSSEEEYLTHRCAQIYRSKPPELSESDILAAVTAARNKKKDRG